MLNYDSISVQTKIRDKAQHKKMLLDIVNQATIYYGKRLLKTEIEGLIHYTKQLNYAVFKNSNRDAVVGTIAKNFIAQLRGQKRTSIDVHETMKKQIGLESKDKSDMLISDPSSSTCRQYSYSADDNALGDIMEIIPQNRIEGMHSNRIEGMHSNRIEGMHSNRIEGMHSNRIEGMHSNRIEGMSFPRPRNRSDTDTIDDNNVPNVVGTPNKVFSGSINKYPMIARQKVQNLYLLLDSKYRNLSTDVSTFSWVVSYSQNTVQGTVNTLSDQIHNIVFIQFDQFQIPYVPSADNVYKKVSLFIEEFSAMSILLNNGGRYHMMFDSEVKSNQIKLTPQYNDEGRFRFYTPINILDTLTIKFRSPFTNVSFLKDRFNISVTPINPTQSLLTFGEDHSVVDGELIYIENFSTLDPSADVQLINLVNREEGHFVTYISNTELRVNIGLSSITPDPSNIALCFVASRRLIVPIRMGYIVL
jgi:hypothetical protein